MLSEKYHHWLSEMIRSFFPEKSQKIFLFGSSVRSEKFRYIDIGFLELKNTEQLEALKSFLEESTFPYLVDLVDMSKTSKDFSDFVLLHEKKIWI